MTPWVRNLILANVLVFLVSMSTPGVINALVFIPALIGSRPWTIISYMFLHASISHILFNMLTLYFFGPRIELRLGSGRFLGLYFVSGLTAALTSFVFAPQAPIVGASGAVYGIMLAYARYWPKDTVFIWGVLPVQIRWLVIATTAASLLFGFVGIQSGVAHFAHLGGFLGGLLYLIWSDRHSPAARFRAQTTPPPRPAAGTDMERWRTIRMDALHPVNRQEVERLLTKIGTGQGPLSAEERAFLDHLAAG